MVGLLDETIRLRCNEVGGYWVKVRPRDWNTLVWVCRIPADVVEKASEVVKEKRGETYSKAPPCNYFHGEHNYFKRKTYPKMGLIKLGFPDETKEFAVCDIFYTDSEGNERYPLTDPIAFEALKQFSHPPKEKIYDNYTPEQPDVLLLVDKDEKGIHYHINYEGSQERLYGRIKEKIKSALTDKQKFIEHYSGNEFTIQDDGKLFFAELYPGSINAAPRIKIRKTTDEFDSVLYKAVDETKTSGQKVGLFGGDEYSEGILFKKEKYDRELARWNRKKKREEY